ncbi:hypothetical protein J2X65_003508 [Ancylobacter sp. 3268]|nr:hypothetical protein [Ancylobacter sp. 3268]
MTGLWIFAFVVLPIVVVAMGYAAMRLNERNIGLPAGE